MNRARKPGEKYRDYKKSMKVEADFIKRYLRGDMRMFHVSKGPFEPQGTGRTYVRPKQN